MHMLALVLGASGLAFFGGEVREAAQKAGIATPAVEYGYEISNPAWVVWPCAPEWQTDPVCAGRNPVPTIRANPKEIEKASQWLLTLWAYHEVCHVVLEHKWPVGTTQEKMDRDHLEVRDCQMDLLGLARYYTLRKIVFGNTHSSVPVRHNAPVFGGTR